MKKGNLPWLVVGVLVVLAVVTMIYTAVSANKVKTEGVTIDVAGVTGWAERHATFLEKTGINVNVIGLNVGDGTTMAIDSMLKAGITPNVLVDFTGRASRYMLRTSKLKAIDLKPYMTKADLEDFIDLGPWTKNGMILGLPDTLPAQAMCVNVTLLRKHNIPIPDASWTIKEFLALSKQLKAAGAWSTVLFAANPSADYLYVNWFGSFGAQWFANGDYTKTTINSEAARQTFIFFDTLVKDGYAPPEAPELWDDAALEIWMKGNVAFMPIRPDWLLPYKTTAKQQKFNEEWFDWIFLPMPKGPGVNAVPTVGAGSTFVAFESGIKELDAAAAKYVIEMTSTWSQEWSLRASANFPSRHSVKQVPQKNVRPEDYLVTKTIVATAGMMDVGYTLPMYSVIREELPRRLQAMWKNAETPEEALIKYADFINEALKK